MIFQMASWALHPTEQWLSQAKDRAHLEVSQRDFLKRLWHQKVLLATPAVGRRSQEDQEFKSSHGYIISSKSGWIPRHLSQNSVKQRRQSGLGLCRRLDRQNTCYTNTRTCVSIQLHVRTRSDGVCFNYSAGDMETGGYLGFLHSHSNLQAELSSVSENKVEGT